MKKLLLICTLFFSVTLIQAQVKKTDWKTPLAQSLVQKFSYSLDEAKKLVNIKESYFNQIQYYHFPHVQGRMDKQQWWQAVTDLRDKELKSMTVLVKDETKAKEVSSFLEGKIPTGKIGVRER